MDETTGWLDEPTVSAWIYDSPRGAAAGQVRLRRLSQRGAVEVEDAATVSWVRGAHRPRIQRVGVGRRDSSWTVTALLRALAPASTAPDEASRWELDPGFVDELRDAIRPDASALVVVSRRARLTEVDLVIERGIARGDVRLLHTPLPLREPGRRPHSGGGSAPSARRGDGEERRPRPAPGGPARA